MTAAASLILTLLLGVGLIGLGRAAGARSLPVAWVVGWTVLWWIIAVAAVVAGVQSGAVAGFLTAGIGVAVWVFRPWDRKRKELLAGSATLLAGAPFILAPPYFYDALVYHLGLPWNWLINGSFAPAAHNLFSHFPLAGETVYLLPVAAGLPAAAAGLHWLTFAVTLVAAWELAQRLGAGRWAWIAPLCLLACWHAVWVAGVAGVDHLVVLAIVVAAVELIGEDSGNAGVLAGGAALGLALATKYVAVIPVGAVLVAVVVSSPGRWRDAVKAGLVGAVLASFWYVRNLVLTGNPVYPLLWKVFGGAGWSARDAARWNGLVHEGVGGLKTYWSGLVKLANGGAGLGPWLIIAMLLAIVALVRGSKRRAIGGVAVAAVLIVAGWLVTAHTTRYALPLIPLLGALAAAGVGVLERPARRIAAAGLLMTAGFGLFLFGRFICGTLGMPQMWFGRVSCESWRHQVTLNDPMPGYRAAGRLLPAGARLLVVGEGRPWGCPRPNGVSSPYDTQLVQQVIEESASASGVARSLHAAGWNDMLINWPELRRLHRSFRVFDFRDRADIVKWRTLIDDLTVRIWYSDGLEIRRLTIPPSRVPYEGGRRP